jgi:hypothetical protein
MKNWKVLILSFMVLLVLTSVAGAGETLYNGIVLPDQWPPDYGAITREPMPVPYLDNLPDIIPINVGRQLFVDDFLIDKTTLQRTFHQPEYCKENPVIQHDKPGEKKSYGVYAAPFSGGACYDPADNLFKLWYTRSRPHSTCYATSTDGINWTKPELDVISGTNIVLKPRNFNSTTVLLDLAAKNPEERFKYFASENFHSVGEDVGWSYSLGRPINSFLQPVSQGVGTQPANRGPYREQGALLYRRSDYIGHDVRGYLQWTGY